ncbi:damage specific DNA binding protein [Aureococcus anophagefferens]|uniref:Damage specific DNA binding protein n=1 Tax=Aureococcus anophagefferens TaxID=44056 RepID=A0ABR1FYR2_AURAN
MARLAGAPEPRKPPPAPRPAAPAPGASRAPPPAETPAALKRARKASGRAARAGAVALLRRAKALEAGTAAVAAARAAAAHRGTSRDEGWRPAQRGVGRSLEGASPPRRRAKIAAKDRAGAEALAARCRELKALAARAARSQQAGGAPRRGAAATTATSWAGGVVDGDVGETALRVGVRSLRLPLAARARDGQAPRARARHAAWPGRSPTAARATGAGRTELARLSLASDGRSLACDFVDCLAADCALDGALVAARPRASAGARVPALHAEVGNGSLTPRAYAARVEDRADADRRLAGHLRRLGDAATPAVAARVKIADAELAEMAEGGL